MLEVACLREGGVLPVKLAEPPVNHIPSVQCASGLSEIDVQVNGRVSVADSTEVALEGAVVCDVKAYLQNEGDVL